jgi:hypothetical protein
VHLVVFIITIYHDARSSECQNGLYSEFTYTDVSGALTGLYRNTALYNTTHQHRTLVCIEFSSRYYVTDPKLCVTTPEGIASKAKDEEYICSNTLCNHHWYFFFFFFFFLFWVQFRFFAPWRHFNQCG